MADVQAYLNHLAVEREVAPSTAKQALSALLFLYRLVLGVQLPFQVDINGFAGLNIANKMVRGSL